MKGTISSVEGHGSIVIIWIDPEDGGNHPIYLGLRAFVRLVEGEGVESPDHLIGRPVFFDGETINFLDNVEVA